MLLDTGSSSTIIASEHAMKSLLKSLRTVCSSQWTTAAASQGDQYQQYVCAPAIGWDKTRIAFVFGGAKTPAMPVSNLVALDPKSNKLRLLVLQVCDRSINRSNVS